MSNVTVEGGLRLFKAVEDAALETCIALAGDSTPLGIGDPVAISAAGATNIGQGPIVQAVTRSAGTTGACYGVVVGVTPTIEGTGAVDFSTKYRKASTAQYVLVRPANNRDVYSISDDGASALTKANIGNNAKLTAANCDTATGLSKFMIDATSPASGNPTFFVHLMGYVQDATNDPTSTGARWLVTLNNVTRSGGTGTAGT